MNIPLTCLILWLKAFVVVESYIPIVRLGDTIVTGYQLKSLNGRDIDAFQNIPYAEPPIGDLRFKRTVPITKLPKIINASFDDFIFCIQLDTISLSKNMIGQEDCLILNVYTPRQRQPSKPLPVVVYVFGGGFMFMSASTLLFGPNKLLDHDLILVTINYRLGVLGFLSTGDEASPGNYAVWDILTSLQWVRDNIRSFGGNPNDVTLYGQSAGAMCISLLLVSPLAKGLFHKVILESGSIFSRRIFNFQPLQGAQSLADSFWCPVTPTQALVDCLRKQSAEELVFHGYVVPMQKATAVLPRFLPVVDKLIVLDNPIELYSKGLFHRVPVLTGINELDGLTFYYLIYKLENRYYENEDNYWDRLKYKVIDTIAISKESEKFLLEQVEEIYLTGVNKSDFLAVRKALCECITDFFFDVPLVELVNYISRYLPTYLYKFKYKGTFSIVNAFSFIDANFYDNTSVIHSDELKFLFSSVMDMIKISKQELAFQKKFIKLWSNFITYGNPTPDGIPIAWEPVKTSELEYLSIDEELITGKGYQSDKVRYINEVVIPCVNKLEQHIFALNGATTNLDINCQIKLDNK